jgi:hypothetical protein
LVWGFGIRELPVPRDGVSHVKEVAPGASLTPELEEARMAVVRRIFEEAAGGATLHAIKRALEAGDVPPPGGGKRWYPMSMARMVRNDAYLPRTVGELREAGVGEEALAALDSDARHGLWWYGRNRVGLTPDAARRRRFEALPESEWIGTPVPDSGIPRETVEAARASLDAAYRPRAKARHRYELAGTLYCAECGLRMTDYSTGSGYRYYACQRRRKWGRGACGGPAERAKRALVGAFGTGLKPGLTWMPPQLRREIYGALGLRVSVRPDGDMYAEARVDAAVVRFSCEVERYAEALMDAERRIEAAGPEGKAAGLDRAERELARRELSSGGADTVMAEVVS